MDAHTWKVWLDDGIVTVEKSAAMGVEAVAIGLEPLAPVHHSATTSTQHHMIDASYYVPFNFTESHPE